MTKTLRYEINEERRPGLSAILDRIRDANPRLSYDAALAQAKTEWHRQQAALPGHPTTSQGEALPDQP